MRWVAADLGSISANIAVRVVLAQQRESRADGVCAMVRKNGDGIVLPDLCRGKLVTCG